MTDKQTADVTIAGELAPGFEQILTPEALAFIAELHRAVRRPPRRAAGAARGAPGGLIAPAATSTSCPRPRQSAAGDWRVAPPAPGLVGPPGGDHRPDRPQDDDQRAELRRQGLARRLRGRQHPAPGTTSSAARSTCATPSTARSTSHARTASRTRSARRELATIVVRPRGWHLHEKHLMVDGEPVAGALVDFGLYFFHSRAGQLDARQRPVLLPAQDREPPGGAPLERRLRLRPGRARHPAGHHPGDGADRDHPGGVRDGGDPLRAARALRRAERGPLGLPVQHHQELPRRRAGSSCCPTATRSP